MNVKTIAVVVFAALIAGAAAVSQSVEQHDAAIAELAAEMPEHAAAFAELSAAAGTADVFAVLDAISANIEAERKHAAVFHRSYKKTTARDLRKYKLMIAKLGGSERRARQQTVAERRESKQLRRQVNANVRTLSRAVSRFQHIQGEERRTTHKKKAAMRHLNNKIADRKTYLKVLRMIRRALSDTSKPTGTRFVEALAVAHQSGLGSAAAAPTVFLQLAEEEAEAVEQTTDNADELEADAEIDSEAFAMEDMPAANELELVAEDEAEDEAEEEADEALDAADAAEEESEAEEEDESEADSEAEAEADAEDEVDSASEARMMQVLEALSTGSRDDNSVGELLQLIDSLIADVRESIASAKKRKVAVLAKYTAQMKNLQELANSIKATIRRLQVTVQNGRARLAALEQTTFAVDASSKENDAQLKAYRAIRKGIRTNWAKYESRYAKNQAKRDKQLDQLAELKRRLAAIEREKGALGIDLSAVNLRYRWKAYPFGACQAACGPSIRVRKVKCLSFSGKPVKHTFCDGQKKPKKQVKCQKKLCPANCVVSQWRPRGKCSNKCGTGVRLHTRKVIEPARFGGACPQQFRLTKHKACRSLRACKPGQQQTAQTRAQGKAAIAARRERRQQQKVANALRRDAERAAALQRRNAGLSGPAAVQSAPLTAEQLRKRAKNRRCRACRPGKAGGACRFKNCLTKAQKLACKSCRKGKSGKACRQRKCKGPAIARKKALKARAAARKAARIAASVSTAPLTPKQEKKRAKNRRCLACAKGPAGRKCRLNNCLTKAQKAACKSCRKGKKGQKCRERKCRGPIRARRAVLKQRKAERKAARKAAAGLSTVPLTAEQERKRAKNRRCLACRPGKEGRKCRVNNCLTKAQKAACKRCRKQKCRERKCRNPIRARIALLKQRKAERKAARIAAAAAAGVPAQAAPRKGAKLRRCMKRCRAGKRGKKCRRTCRNKAIARRERREAAARKAAAERAERRRIREERRKRKAAERLAREEALQRRREEEARAAAAALAPATPAPAAAPASPAPASDMSPEVVVPAI